MNAQALKTEAHALRLLADLEESEARALLMRVKVARKAAEQLDAAASAVETLSAPTAQTDFLT